MISSVIPKIFMAVLAPRSYTLTQPRLMQKHSLTGTDVRTFEYEKQLCKTLEELFGNWAETGNGMVLGKDNFTVKMDVKDFQPEEISIKIVNNTVLFIEAKHEERDVKNKHMVLHVMKKFTIPKGFNLSKITSQLTSDGRLAVSAPKLFPIKKIDERPKTIPIKRVTQNDA